MSNKSVTGLLTLSLVSIPLSMPSKSLAEGLYAGIQYAVLQYEQPNLSDAEPTALAIRGGLGINRRVAIEARLGLGVNDDKVKGAGLTVERLIGFYAKAEIMANAMVSPYLIGGWTYVDIENDNQNKDDHDISYGAGIDISIGESLSVNFEYMAITDNFDNVAEINAIQLGVNYQF